MAEIKYHILPARQLKVYHLLNEKSWLQPFYLADGTALALQIGHRKSYDLDFFTAAEFENDQIIAGIEEIGKLERFAEAKNTIHGRLKDVRISFIRHHYPLLGELLVDHCLKIASLKDIAAMKMSAVNSRGTKKDFIDIYFLLKIFSLENMLEFYKNKYGTEFYEYMLTKSLLWFEDAEADPMPFMVKHITWEEVKHSITKAVKQL